VPMIAMGDEVRRTQDGNNNAYCQDNELSWFDWRLVERHAHLVRFVSLLCERRLLRNVEIENLRVSLDELLRGANIAWSGTGINQPDWSDGSRRLAFTAELPGHGLKFHLILNAHWEPAEFDLPPAPDRGSAGWRRWIDTALESPDDIVPWRTAPSVAGASYRAESRSVVMLFAALHHGARLEEVG